MKMDDSKYDFELDPEFGKNFYENIEKVLSDVDSEPMEFAEDEDVQITQDMKLDNDTSDIDALIDNTNEELAATKNINVIDEEMIDEELYNINASLAEQICEELEQRAEEAKTCKRSKFPKWVKIPAGIMVGLILLVSFLGLTKPGNALLMNMGMDLGGKIWATWTNDFATDISAAEDIDHLEEDDLNSEAPEMDPNQIIWPGDNGEGRREEGVYNILLLGEEAIGSGTSRGRTDLMIIATLNTNTKEVKLTSIMRDTLVQIPGYKDNKINSVYEKGGIDLLYDVMALNFNIHLDGCALVNFENFEKIIDEIGGLEITLTQGEANYLNSTNYISNPAYRNVKAGKQILNGNQVLGYSRVRKRATITGNNNDFGRTDRHRIILNAIFEEYKTKSKVELASIMLKLLPMITTDIGAEHFELLLNSFLEMGTMEMQQLRIPADGTFNDRAKVRGMYVLILDMEKNIDILHSFIFGEEEAVEETADY
ncbi:MAG: LCP family protein [Clostridiales bacterium]|nr:LCP family protein [Clostridiales bacterium]